MLWPSKHLSGVLSTLQFESVASTNLFAADEAQMELENEQVMTKAKT